MKTREIELKITENDFRRLVEGKKDSVELFTERFVVHPAHGKTLKAKLIIEIPEKKIEITESEFNEVVDSWQRKAEGSDAKFIDLRKLLIEKLFNKGADSEN